MQKISVSCTVAILPVASVFESWPASQRHPWIVTKRKSLLWDVRQSWATHGHGTLHIFGRTNWRKTRIPIMRLKNAKLKKNCGQQHHHEHMHDLISTLPGLCFLLSAWGPAASARTVAAKPSECEAAARRLTCSVCSAGKQGSAETHAIWEADGLSVTDTGRIKLPGTVVNNKTNASMP